MVKKKRYYCNNIYGMRMRPIRAVNVKEALRRAWKGAEKCYSESYLKKKFGRVPKEMF